MSYVCNSMLTKYQIESELSLAYLHAVAAKAGYAIDVPAIDNDSVDATQNRIPKSLKRLMLKASKYQDL